MDIELLNGDFIETTNGFSKRTEIVSGNSKFKTGEVVNTEKFNIVSIKRDGQYIFGEKSTAPKYADIGSLLIINSGDARNKN